MSRKILIPIAIVLFLFNVFGRYSGYNVSEIVLDFTTLAFWVLVLVVIVLRAKEK